MSQASWSSATSQSSLTRRISETTRARSSSWLVSAGTRLSTLGVDAAVHAGLAGAGQRRGQVVDVPDGQPQRGGHLVQRGAAAGPQLAVLPVPEELVGLAGGARPRIEHGLAVLDDEHGVAGLVAGVVGVRGVGAEPVVGVVGPHLVAARGQHQPLAGERLGEPGTAVGGELGDRVRRQVELPVAPAGAHERLPGRGHGGVVRLGPGSVDAAASGAASWESPARWSSARSRPHCTPERGAGGQSG